MRNEIMIKPWLVQFIIYISVLLFGLGVAWAAYGSRLSELEKISDIYSKDHDAVVMLNTKMDMLLKAVGEIQKDLKDRLKR